MYHVPIRGLLLGTSPWKGWLALVITRMGMTLSI